LKTEKKLYTAKATSMTVPNIITDIRPGHWGKKFACSDWRSVQGTDPTFVSRSLKLTD